MISAKIEKAAKVLLYSVPVLALIFINGFYFPFIINRTLYFRLIIELAVSLYILLLALNYRKYRPKFNLALILVLIFLAVNLLAGIFGLDFYKSFWSNFERLEGIIGLIYLTVYLFLLLNFFKTKKDWLLNLRLVLAVSLLVSLYGLAQKFSLLPVFESGVDRISSTIGNAAFLAGFLLLAIGLGIYYYVNEENKKYKYFALFACGVNLLVLLLTATRGAILGLVIGGLFWLILNVIFSQGKLKKYSIIALIILLFASSGFYLARRSLAKSSIAAVSRLATISIADPTVSNRLLVWQMPLKEFKLRPWLGAGLENFNIIYNKYFTPRISEDWFDRTHNVYLDQLAANGLAGLIIYLIIFGYLILLLFKKRRDDYYQFTILASLLVAYAIHNFFVFDTISTSFIYFFLIALISFKNSADEPIAEIKTEPLVKANQAMVKITFLLLIMVNLYAFYRLIYLPLKINRNLYIGYYYTLADQNRSYESFKAALSYKFGSVESANQLNNTYDVLESGSATNQPELEKFYNLTKEKSEFAIANYPLDIMLKLRLGQLLINNYKSPADLNQAEAMLKDCVKLSPGRTESYYLLYNLYAREKDNVKAESIIKDLINKLPWFGDAKIVLATEIYKSEPTQAEQLFNQGMEQFHTLKESTLKKIIEYLLNVKRYQDTIPYYLQLIAAVPERLDYRIDLSKVYYLSGQLDQAIEQINFINSKSPQTLKGNEPYLKLLFESYNK